MLEWVISSAVLTALVIALRFILKGKISLRLQYALWALVLLRLLVPVSFGATGLSVGNLTQKVAETEAVQTVSTLTQLELPRMTYSAAYSEVAKEYAEKGIDIAEMPIEAFETVDYEILSRMGGEWSIRDVLKAVWLFGIVAVGLALLASNICFAAKLRRSRYRLDTQSCPLLVYVSPNVETPCLFGLFHPAIYITPEAAADETVLRHTVEHELTHFRHGDHIWSLLRGACLTLHWYNPLVWWAAVLSRNDAELACDEATIKRIGESERAEYGRTLIEMTCQKRPALLLTATTMTGSKSSIKERIMLIAKKPKTAIYTLIAVVLIAALAVGCTFTGAKDGSYSDADQMLYDRAGLTVAIPNEYIDRLYIPDILSENELIRVYEKQSYEESRADWGEDSYAGFLFGIVRYTQAQYEGYLSSEGSGLSFFAKDDAYYYGHGYATDVQFYRSDIDTYTEDVFAPWNELTDAVDGILDDFVSRNNLTAYSDDEFWGREFTYDSEHIYMTYYPYYTYQDTATAQGFTWQDVAYKFVLSQPATQGKTGIWCIERWYDSNGTVYYYFPSRDNQTDLAAADYYAQLQAECDDGHRPGLLDSVQAAMEFAVSYFGHTPALDSFELFEPLTDNVTALCNDLFASGDVALTLHLANDGTYNTYSASEWYSGRFEVLLRGYKWTEMEMPITEPSDFWITSVSADGSKTMRFWSDSNAGTVQYSDGDTTVYWSASPNNDDSVSIAEDIRDEYDNLDVDCSRISFYLDGSAEDAADAFVHSAYGSHMMNLAPGNMYGMSDYDVVNWGVREVSEDDEAVVGWFECAFTPWDFDSPGIWAGNTGEATGQYEGKLTFSREFVLQRQDDSYWHCTDLGTGGASLPE